MPLSSFFVCKPFFCRININNIPTARIPTKAPNPAMNPKDRYAIIKPTIPPPAVPAAH